MNKKIVDISEKWENIQQKKLTRKIIMYCILEVLLIFMFIIQLGKMTTKEYFSLIAFILINGFAIYYFSNKKRKIYYEGDNKQVNTEDENKDIIKYFN